VDSIAVIVEEEAEVPFSMWGCHWERATKISMDELKWG
jgi:hypothetical protein